MNYSSISKTVHFWILSNFQAILIIIIVKILFFGSYFKIDKESYGAGIHWIGFGHSFIKFPKTVQTIEFSHEKTADY